MTAKTRLIILLLCVVCFFAIAPIIVGYSMGYRIDFDLMKIVATGGIYVRTFPTADNITIDSKISAKPGMFANSIFVQSLLPKNHTVLVQKDGYFDYSKTLTIEENQVTKLENILLFKKDIKFSPLPEGAQSPIDQPEKLEIKKGSLYSSDQKNPLIKNVLAFKELGNNIIWLDNDGFLYEIEISALPVSTEDKPKKLALKPIKIVKNGAYKIIANSQYLFLDNNSELLLLNTGAQSFETFAKGVSGASISPDGKNIIYFTSSQIYIYPFSEETEKTLLFQSKNISNVLWLNDNYIIFSEGNKISITETDYRGNINVISLPGTFEAPKIYFAQAEGKLYVLSKEIIMVSEKILP